MTIGRQRPAAVAQAPAGEPPRDAADAPALDLPDQPADAEWAQVWFALQRQRWSTLAVVPADPAHGALDAARALFRSGYVYQNNAVRLIDATAAEPYEIAGLVAAAAETAAAGAQVVVAVGSPLANPAAIAIARALDAAVLVVPVGRARLGLARRAIESVGREHFIGSVALQPGRAPQRP